MKKSRKTFLFFSKHLFRNLPFLKRSRLSYYPFIIYNFLFSVRYSFDRQMPKLFCICVKHPPLKTSIFILRSVSKMGCVYLYEYDAGWLRYCILIGVYPVTCRFWRGCVSYLITVLDSRICQPLFELRL